MSIRINGRAITAGLVSLAVLGTTVGVPLPPPVSDRPVVEDGADFPCRDHHCGCRSAERCRTNCCCFKPAVPEPVASCCSSKPAASSQANGVSQPDRETSTGFVLAIQAQRCGNASLWQLAAMPWLCLIHAPRPLLASPLMTSPNEGLDESLSPQSSVDPASPPPRISI